MALPTCERADLDGTPSWLDGSFATGNPRVPAIARIVANIAGAAQFASSAGNVLASSLHEPHPRRPPCPDHTYKLLELTGSSTTSIEDAVSSAIAKAGKTLRNMHWFQVTETRGQIADGKVAYWQITLKIGFTLED